MVHRGNAPSYTLTYEDAIQVHILCWNGWYQHRIAAQFDVNPGRVAEVLSGKLHPGSMEAAKRWLREFAA